MQNRNTRYRLIFRGLRGGMYYCVDKTTRKCTSLNTSNEDEARQFLEAKNIAERQPTLNLHIAKAYLAGTDNGINTGTWQQAIEALMNTKRGANKAWRLNVTKDRALAPLSSKVIIETLRTSPHYYAIQSVDSPILQKTRASPRCFQNFVFPHD